jgi:hypothetical protein
VALWISDPCLFIVAVLGGCRVFNFPFVERGERSQLISIVYAPGLKSGSAQRIFTLLPMLRKYLEMISYIELGQLQLMPKHKSLHTFLLRHGRAFAPRERPKNMRRGKMGYCYQNAISFLFKNARRSSRKLVYCEGYAIKSDVGIPMMHGWLCDMEGNVIDLTWDDVTDYWGVPFQFSFGERAPAVFFGNKDYIWKQELKTNDENKAKRKTRKVEHVL